MTAGRPIKEMKITKEEFLILLNDTPERKGKKIEWFATAYGVSKPKVFAKLKEFNIYLKKEWRVQDGFN